MVYRSYSPSAPLSAFIESFWYFEAGATANIAEKVMPNGTTALIIDLAEDSQGVASANGPITPAIIVGLHTAPVIIEPARLKRIMGVQFRPGGSVPFFDMPVSELHNIDVPLTELWATAVDELREKLIAATSISQRFRILEYSLQNRLWRAKTVHPVVLFALERFTSNLTPVGDVVEKTGFSQTRFTQLFRESVGVTPKLYCRIQRFQSALRESMSQPVDWAGIAAGCGYFDQSHFVHEFQSLAGMTPSAYLATRTQFQNHVTV